MLLGQARGKMGSIVFFVRDGAQQQRPYVEKQKNPRTTPQMLQRVKLAAVVGFYKRQASFFRFALKKKKNESYYNAFVRYNLNYAPYLTQEQSSLGFQIPAPYIISDGDMPQIGVSAVSVSTSNYLSFNTSINSSLKTWGAMRKAYGLLLGDMITVVIFNRGTLSTDQTSRIIIQHVFDQESENMPIGYDMVGSDWDGQGAVWSLTIDKEYFGVTEWYAVGAAVITSRNAGGVDCSYAQLALSENAEALYLTFHSDEQHQEAAASYGSMQDAILDPKSFEGNYVDIVKLFNNQTYTQPVGDLVMFDDTGKTLYFDKSKYPDIVDGEPTWDSSDIDLGGVSVDVAAGTVTIDPDLGSIGRTVVTINWLNAEGYIVYKSEVKVTVNQHT